MLVTALFLLNNGWIYSNTLEYRNMAETCGREYPARSVVFSGMGREAAACHGDQTCHSVLMDWWSAHINRVIFIAVWILFNFSLFTFCQVTGCKDSLVPDLTQGGHKTSLRCVQNSWTWYLCTVLNRYIVFVLAVLIFHAQVHFVYSAILHFYRYLFKSLQTNKQTKKRSINHDNSGMRVRGRKWREGRRGEGGRVGRGSEELQRWQQLNLAQSNALKRIKVYQFHFFFI